NVFGRRDNLLCKIIIPIFFEFNFNLRFSSGRVWMDVGLETLRKSAGRIIRAGSRVNLERSLSLASRIHGHIVYGHVMCTGKVAKIIKKSNTKIFNIESSESFTSKLIEKGSVAVNGVSLTVNEISGGSFWVAVIPQTLKRSNLGDLRHSKVVNLEADMLVAALRQGRV
ncbi:MAG: hypothetical protein ACQESB_00005, partial [Elusimicrobiota bacterium]